MFPRLLITDEEFSVSVELAQLSGRRARHDVAVVHLERGGLLGPEKNWRKMRLKRFRSPGKWVSPLKMIWDRYYDFQNIFTKKIAKIMAVFCSNYC
jgi:hypothetical protein